MYRPHVLSVNATPYSPYREFSRQAKLFGMVAAHNFAVQDVNERIIHRNIHNLVQFLDKCQVKFDLSHKVATMFGQKGLLH